MVRQLRSENRPVFSEMCFIVTADHFWFAAAAPLRNSMFASCDSGKNRSPEWPAIFLRAGHEFRCLCFWQ
jgi:hypothetical protein